MLSRAAEPDSPIPGFTLIEAVVALALMATVLASISALIATTVRGTRSIESRMMRLQAARSIYAALPDRQQLAPGHLTGTTMDHNWRVDVAPFAARVAKSQWVPLAVNVSVESPNGGTLQISTIRLHRRPRP